MDNTMKTKTFFVTNSSSTSFIMINYETTKEVAKKALNIILKDHEDEGKKLKREIVEQLYFNLDNLDDNDNIYIPLSLDYGTFIYRIDQEKIAMETSDIHSWLDVENGLEIYDQFSDDRQSDFLTEYGDFSSPCIDILTGDDVDVLRKYNILRKR